MINKNKCIQMSLFRKANPTNTFENKELPERTQQQHNNTTTQHDDAPLITSWSYLEYSHAQNAAKEVQARVAAHRQSTIQWDSNETCPWETTASVHPFINTDYVYWSDRTWRIPSWKGSADWKHGGCCCCRRSQPVQTETDKPIQTLTAKIYQTSAVTSGQI